MTAAAAPDWLHTAAAVRELMSQRLASESFNGETRLEVQATLEELDVLLRELQRYAEIFQYSPDAYVITEAAGTVREANRAALEILGATRDELLSRPLLAYLADDAMPLFGSGPASWQTSLRRPDGAVLQVRLQVRDIPVETTGVRGLCWLIRPQP